MLCCISLQRSEDLRLEGLEGFKFPQNFKTLQTTSIEKYSKASSCNGIALAETHCCFGWSLLDYGGAQVRPARRGHQFSLVPQEDSVGWESLRIDRLESLIICSLQSSCLLLNL